MKTKHLYTLQQKKWVVALVKIKSVAAAVEHFKILRTTINRWMEDGYFEHKRTKGGHSRGQGRPLTYDKAVDGALLCWVLEAREQHLPISKTIVKGKAMELIEPGCLDFKVESAYNLLL